MAAWCCCNQTADDRTKQEPAGCDEGWLAGISVLAHQTRGDGVSPFSIVPWRERLLSLAQGIQTSPLPCAMLAQRVYRVPDASPPSTDAPMSDKQAYMIEHLNELPWQKVGCLG